MMRMRTIVLIFAGLAMLSLPGCGGSKITEAEYSAVWQVYSAHEFEEGFFGKLSSEQKRRIFVEIADKAQLDISGLDVYMKSRHPQAHSQIFE